MTPRCPLRRAGDKSSFAPAVGQAGVMEPGRSEWIATAVPWVARLAWVLVAVLGGAAIESAVDGRSAGVRWTAAIGAWATWALVAASLAVAAVWSLTVARLGVPLALLAAAASAIAGADALDVAVLAATAGVATVACFAAEFGQRWVQASAYGDEVRFPLRPPAGAGLVAVAAWLLWAPCLVAGPLLLAAGTWPAGVPVTVLAVAGAVVLLPRWHRLSLRWLVLVPAGLVVHDPVVLADTLMLRTRQLGALQLAPAETGAKDLTGPASGYAIEVTTIETVTTVLAFTPRAPDGTAIHLTAFLVAPSRPGAALRTAAARRLPVVTPAAAAR